MKEHIAKRLMRLFQAVFLMVLFYLCYDPPIWAVGMLGFIVVSRD